MGPSALCGSIVCMLSSILLYPRAGNFLYRANVVLKLVMGPHRIGQSTPARIDCSTDGGAVAHVIEHWTMMQKIAGSSLTRAGAGKTPACSSSSKRVPDAG